MSLSTQSIMPSPGEDGFTLVELLVSLALLALMITYALTAFSTLRQLNRIAGYAAAQDEVDSALRHLRQDIGDARVLFETQTDGSQILIFDGDEGHLRYIASSDGTRETGGLYQVYLFRNEQSELIAERQLVHAAPEGPLTSVVLLRGIASLEFAYAEAARSGSNIVWQNKWTSRNALPASVRMTIGFAPDDRRRWPEAIVLVRAAR